MKTDLRFNSAITLAMLSIALNACSAQLTPLVINDFKKNGIDFSSKGEIKLSEHLNKLKTTAVYNGLSSDESSRIQTGFLIQLTYNIKQQYATPHLFSYEDVTKAIESIGIIVDVQLESLPDKSTVSIIESNEEIGDTSISKKFRADDEITFLFKKEGYKSMRKKYKVMGYPEKQVVKVELVKE